MSDSARMTWVREHARELIEIAARYGAEDVCLCGSVARGEDAESSDLDFFVWMFDDTTEDARDRADALVKDFRESSPYEVDVRGIPGWLIDARQEEEMRHDSIRLAQLAPPGSS